jgi:GMP synthase (glutamine-hydrolysing)
VAAPPPTPRVAVVQHTAVCPPGRVGQWLSADGCALDVYSCFAGKGLPSSLRGYAGLVVLGGEMGAYDDALHPWLSGTKALLREAVAAQLPTLGICLGLQLLAVATGGRVAAAVAGPQLGVRAVEPTAAAAADPLFGGLAPGALGVHWNNDLVVDLPPDTTVLATSAGTVQALRVGAAAWGVQHHPEVDVATLRLWADADVAAGLLDEATAAARLAEVERHDAALAQVWRAVVGRFAALLRPSGSLAGAADAVDRPATAP